MAKKDGRRYEVELDWYYISKESVWKWLVGFVLAAAALVVGIYWLTHRGADIPSRATAEIRAADELLAKARSLPEAARMREELDAGGRKLADARSAFDAKRYSEALGIAVEARSLAQRLLGGASSRHDAVIMDFGGKVEVQRANRATWEPGRVGMKLYEGDFLKTGANGLAEVMSVDGTYYRIKPETLFEVHRVSTVPGAGGEPVRRSEIKFIVGTVDVSTGEGTRSVVRTDAVTADIASRSNVGVDVDSSKNTGVSTYQGSATLSTGSGARLVVGERERAVANLGAEGIGPKVRLPDPPRLLAPEDMAIFDARRKEPVTLRWERVSDAVLYRLQIARSRLFLPDSIIVVDDRPRTEAVVTVTGEGSFYWRLASIGKGKVVSDWSVTRRFKVVSAAARARGPDTVPPELVVLRPQVNGTFVIVSGRTEPGSSVTVNGEPADLDSSGAFRKVVSVTKEGVNTILVRAVDGAGNETVRRENVVIEYY